MMQNQQFMQGMMDDPEFRRQMVQNMRDNHDFTQGMLMDMMDDPELRQQMIGHMLENQEFMQEMRLAMDGGTADNP
jgi:uncharacterized protein (DUF736 family)